MQRYLNFWASSSLDLFGAEISSNAAAYFASGIKGRPDETRFEDHVCGDATFTVERPAGDAVVSETVAMRNAMNEVTRSAYIRDCELGLKFANRLIERAGHASPLALPSRRFRRTIGAWAGQPVDPAGRIVPPSHYQAGLTAWLPTDEDKAFIKSLMRAVIEPGKMAAWIAPPRSGIDGRPLEYEYVRLN